MARKIKISIMCINIVLFFFVSCSNRIEKEYHVALSEMPGRIDPVDGDVNYALHIIMQLHEPLFLHGSSNRLYSRILKSWETFDNYSCYRFCLKDNILFSNGKALNVKTLKNNFEYFNNKSYFKYPISSFNESDHCLDVVFHESYPQFLNNLMSYKTSIIDPSTRNDKIVIGISPYRAIEMNSKLIHLRGSGNFKFKDIYYHYWDPKTGKTLWKFDDINLIPSRYLTGDMDKFMNKYEVALLKTYVVIINHPDKRVRDYLYNCTDYEKLRRILYPNKTEFLNIQGVLPLGISGSIAGKSEQSCPSIPFPNKIKTTLLTFYFDAVNELQKFYDNSFLKLNIEVKVVPINPNDLIQTMRSKEKDYGMTIVGLDAIYPSAESFLDYFIPGETLWTRVKNPSLEQIISGYNKSTNSLEKDNLLRKANLALIQNRQILPLFQENRPFYFSKKLKHITSDQLFMGIPTISELK